MILCDISSKRKIDKIPISCDICNCEFERELRGVLKQRNQRNKDLCIKCSKLKEHRHIELPKKNKYKCEVCENIFERTYKNFLSNKKKNKKIICGHCSNVQASVNRPQTTKEYWGDAKRKEKHSNSMKNSIAHKEAMQKLDLTKENNGMYNKQHTIEARNKMSKTRTGKVQSKETIQKRINTIKLRRDKKLIEIEYFNVNQALRGYINNNIQWYKRIYERDGYKCVKCGSTNKLDAHHIKSFNSIIKELLQGMNLKKSIDEYFFLREQPEILDENLTNGITLCRSCHKLAHGHKWGSHKI